ncbi:MAG: alpha/beta fold hydrolase [Microscillaceae bacterium]|nr:alpha/beta fold hydrolase [Microscillaceae bacterium]
MMKKKLYIPLLIFLAFSHFSIIFKKPVFYSVEADYEFGNGNGTFAQGQAMLIQYKVRNLSDQTVKGFVAGSVSTQDAKILHSFEKYVEIPASQSQILSFSYQPSQPGIYKVFTRLRNSGGDLAANSIQMGYAVDHIHSPITRKADFYQFWHQTIQKLKTIAPNFKVIPKAQLSNHQYDVYLIEMQSFDNQTIRAWYRIPKHKNALPVVLQLPSLGGSFYDVRSLEEKPRHGIPYDFAVLSLNIRGHGNSQDDIDPGDNHYQLITHQLHDREQYFYRGAVMDCIRALDFLQTRPELDKNKIVVEGASQGGALSLITAALDARVKLCAPDVPFLSDIDQLIKYAPWVANELARYQKSQVDLSLWRMQYTLSYFDTKNFADKIKAPVFMGIGLQDGTCPAITSLVTYNKISAIKKCYIYPKAQHEGGGALHRERKFAWIRQQFGL